MKATTHRSRFHPVHVATAAPVIEFSTVGARVEGLDVETAAKLLALLRCARMDAAYFAAS